ncbi:MAG: acyl--CoA ligase [Melioribacteraceae bacterium]|nr:acyl--CoA ligase [Melioribacteraceae bacterium]
MSLLKKIESALNNKGNFQIIEGGKAVLSSSEFDFSGCGNKIIFWSLSNNAENIWLLLHALFHKVIPIIIPAKISEFQIDSLFKTYPGFGLFKNKKIIFNNEPVKANSKLFLAMLTSGSTGEPKLIAATEIALEHSIKAIDKAQGLEDINSTGVVLPLHYSYAFVNQLLWAIYYQKELIITKGFSPPVDAMIELEKSKAEMLCMVGTQLHVLSNLGFDKTYKLNGVKLVNFAGSPFPVSNYSNIKSLFPKARIINNYGCTEALPRLTVKNIDDSYKDNTNVGYPIPGIKLRIVGETPGLIEFSGASASIGILEKDGNITKHPEWIKSGDIGTLKENNLFLFGRDDQIVKIGGERFSLITIENAFLSVAEIDYAFAFLSKKNEENSFLETVICGKKRPELVELQRTLKLRLPFNAMPSVIYWVEHCPKTSNEKMDRVAVRELINKNKLEIFWKNENQSRFQKKEV